MLSVCACHPAASRSDGGDGFGPPVATGIDFEVVLTDFPVSSAQRVAQQTPLAVSRDAVYVATLEPAPGNDEDPETGLHTVVRKATRAGNGSWEVRKATIDERGVRDAWHTPPGIGVDERGTVHVAWNMHNFPWQYATSTTPDSLDGFDFRGEALTAEALRRHVEENRTDFPERGSAAIPGTQITYPAFYNDRDGRLWVTYRQALRPALDFAERAMGIGVARFEAGTGVWKPVGAALDARPGDWSGAEKGAASSPAFAVTPGWTAYNAKLGFSRRGWQLQWAWREGIAGSSTERPCLALVTPRASGSSALSEVDVEGPNGDSLPLPVPVSKCGNLGLASELRYHSIGDFSVDSNGRAAILLSPVGGSRMLLERRDDGAWTSERPPNNGTAIFHDREDRLWVVGDGPTIYLRPDRASEWVRVHAAPEDGATWTCEPRVALDPARRRAWLYARACDANRVSVATFSIDVLVTTPTVADGDQG